MCFMKQRLVFYHSTPQPFILPDIVQREYNTWNRIGKFHFKFGKKKPQDFLIANFHELSWLEEIFEFQLSFLKEILGHVDEELLGMILCPASPLTNDLLDISLARCTDELSLLKASQEATCFFSRRKIRSCCIEHFTGQHPRSWPQTAQMLG